MTAKKVELWTNYEEAISCARAAEADAKNMELPLAVAINGVTHAILALIDQLKPKPQEPINIHPVSNAPGVTWLGNPKKERP